MEFVFKEDWPEARRRLEAWWQREIIDRCAFMVGAPRTGVTPRELPPPRAMKSRWTDPAYVIEHTLARCESTFFGGECVPSLNLNVGPTCIGQFLGCDVVYQETTTWKRPFVDDWDRDCSTVTFDPENENWKDVVRLTEEAVKAAPGRFFVGVTDLGGYSDALSAFRGPERLCLDLIDCPEKLLRLRKPILEVWKKMFDTLHQIIRRTFEECIGWMGIWAPGTTFHPQDDFSCMISKKMYDEVFVPALVEQVRYIDYPIYHLDGPGAIRHLDTLLAIDELPAIQWVPGAGREPMTLWIPLIKRIQKAGKGVVLFCGRGDVEELMRELSSRGLMLVTDAPTEEDARELLKKVKTWTHD
jgi:hypothetical protein